MTVHSRKGLGGEGEGGSRPCGHSGALVPKKETSELSASEDGSVLGVQG